MGSETSVSTNPQGWRQKYTKNRPLRKAKETVYAGITARWFYIIGFWAFISMLLLVLLLILRIWITNHYLSLIAQCFILALEVSWWVIFFKYFRTTEHFDNSKVVMRFIIDEYLGHHQICKFDMAIKTLLTYVGIVEIYLKGLIKFTQDRYGVLYQYWPLNISEDDMDRHLQAISAIENRLTGDMMLAWIGSSRFGTPSPLLKKLETMMSNPKIPKEEYKLLFSQYEKIKYGEVTPDWTFYLFVGLGTCKTIEEAQEKLIEELPGIEDSLEYALMPFERIVDKNEIIKHYIQFMVPRDLL